MQSKESYSRYPLDRFHFISAIIFAAFIFIFSSPVFISAEIDMDMNATPNPVGSGARAMGIGGAFISVADDATAASWNPAGLLQLVNPEVSVVRSFFSGKIDYKTSGVEGADVEDSSPESIHLNYLSFVYPFILFRRNFVVSFNYQHLYEFSKDDIYTYTLPNEGANDETKRVHKRQRGSLSTFSPALAFQINPSLFVGLTANFWPGDILDNGWENINISKSSGDEMEKEFFVHTEIYERYDFSGFNMNIGFLYTYDALMLWGENRRLRIGGVIKTPFDADIRHEQREISYKWSHQHPSLNRYTENLPPSKKLILQMPLSYGLGTSIFFRNFTFSLDIYRTHWEQYLIQYPSGEKYSPINKRLKENANIQPTTQVRMGSEYRILQDPKKIISLRSGIFYDPEPATDNPDDFYGVSIGTGITYDEAFSLDIMYQYRFGERKEAEEIMGESPCGEIAQHYIYASLIYYFKE